MRVRKGSVYVYQPVLLDQIDGRTDLQPGRHIVPWPLSPNNTGEKAAMLSHKVAVYIPSTQGNVPAPAELVNKMIEQAKRLLSGLFGGFTAYKAQGGWVSPTQGLVEEDVTIVQAFTDKAGLSHVPAVKALASQIANDMGQEAVSVEVDNTLHFIK
jgi:hypothetical protein